MQLNFDLTMPSYAMGMDMGTFSETANVVYRLSFADQGKQTFVFPSSISSVFAYIYIWKMELYILCNIYKHRHINVHVLVSVQFMTIYIYMDGCLTS
jgi:hypothetical protein